MGIDRFVFIVLIVFFITNMAKNIDELVFARIVLSLVV